MKPALVLLATLSFAQDEPPTFRSTTRLVEVSVSVTGSSGRPVNDLKREDFIVKAAGRTRPVAYLQFDAIAGTNRPAETLPKYVYTNRPEFQPPEARNVTAIVIDSLNTNVADGVRLRLQLLRWLQQLPPGRRVALYQLTSTGLRSLYDFTGDPEDLRRRIAKLPISRLPGPEEDAASLKADTLDLADVFGASASQWQQSMDRLLSAEREQAGRMKTARLEAAFGGMAALAAHLQEVPGRKNLIWAGGGLPLLQVIGNLSSHDPHRQYVFFDKHIEDTARRLAAANVVLYYFDARGLQAPPVNAAGRTPQAVSDAQRITEDARIGTTRLASKTGGRYTWTSNSVETAFEAAQADLDASYTLAFYADEERGKDWVPMTIEVKRPGLRLRHRDGYSLTTPPAAAAAESAQQALRRPLSSDAILLNARCEPDRASGPAALRLFVQIDAETLPLNIQSGRHTGTLEVTLAEITSEGRVLTHSEKARVNVQEKDWPRVLNEGIAYTRQWTPNPSAERLRILVRSDETGQAGTLDIALRTVYR